MDCVCHTAHHEELTNRGVNRAGIEGAEEAKTITWKDYHWDRITKVSSS